MGSVGSSLYWGAARPRRGYKSETFSPQDFSDSGLVLVKGLPGSALTAVPILGFFLDRRCAGIEPSGRRWPCSIKYFIASCAAADLADFLLGNALVRDPRGSVD